MLESSAVEQINLFINYLSKRPDLQEVADYLSQNISPDREICGIGISILGENQVIETLLRSGIRDNYPKLDALPIASKHPIAMAFHTRNIIYMDFQNIGEEFSGLAEIHKMFGYQTAITGIISEKLVLGILFDIPFKKIIDYRTYFECLYSTLSMYLALQSKNFVNEFELSGELSPRQKAICEMILQGKSNRLIAQEMAYSISLIRQETMRIYAKLGVDGRSELKKKLTDQV